MDAHNEEPLYVVGRPIKVDYAPERTEATPEPYHKLYISSFNKGEEALREAFASYGDRVTDVHISTFVLSHKFRMSNQ